MMKQDNMANIRIWWLVKNRIRKEENKKVEKKEVQ